MSHILLAAAAMLCKYNSVLVQVQYKWFVSELSVSELTCHRVGLSTFYYLDVVNALVSVLYPGYTDCKDPICCPSMVRIS